MRGSTFTEQATVTLTDFSCVSMYGTRYGVNKMCCAGTLISPELSLLKIN